MCSQGNAPTHSLSFSCQSHSAGRIHLILINNLFYSAALVQYELHSSSVSLKPIGPGCLESGSMAVLVILKGCYRCRNTKSIKSPMNQHSWPAPLGHCATLAAAPPHHCLSSSLNPVSGTEYKGPISQTCLLSPQCIYFLGCCLFKRPT